MIDKLSQSSEWSKGWPIVFASTVGIALCLSAVPYYTLIAMSDSLIAEFGWQRSELLASLIFMSLGAFLGAPVIGWLTDKVGARRVVLPSILLLAAGMAAFKLQNGSLIAFYSIFFLTSLLSVGTLPITWTKSITAQFDRNRGIALGIALMGTGVFGWVAPFYAQWLVDSFGVLNAYLGIAILPLCISFPIAFIFFREPKKTAAEQALADTNRPLPGYSMAEVAKNYRVYILVFSFLVLGMAISGMIANSKFILLNKGYTPQDATSFLIGINVIGLAVIFGRALGGWLVDHFWAPKIAAIFMSLPIVSCMIFMNPDSGIVMNTLALVLAGFAAGVEFDMMAYLVSRYFGMKSYGRVYGIIYAFFAIGSGFAPSIYAKITEVTGSFQMFLIIAAVSFGVGSALLLLLGKYPIFQSPETSELR